MKAILFVLVFGAYIEDGHISIKKYLIGGGASPHIGEKQVVAVMERVLIESI